MVPLIKYLHLSIAIITIRRVKHLIQKIGVKEIISAH